MSGRSRICWWCALHILENLNNVCCAVISAKSVETCQNSPRDELLLRNNVHSRNSLRQAESELLGSAMPPLLVLQCDYRRKEFVWPE